mgnify:CR=1 FL=1
MHLVARQMSLTQIALCAAWSRGTQKKRSWGKTFLSICGLPNDVYWGDESAWSYGQEAGSDKALGRFPMHMASLRITVVPRKQTNKPGYQSISAEWRK